MKSLQSDSGGWPRLSPWVLRVPAAVVLAVILAFQYDRITGFGSALMYTASWIILLHVWIGEYVFIRTLHATSRNQQLLDALAGLLLLGGLLSFRQSALWCAFLAGAFALAITKYLLIEQHIGVPELKRYAREKILWESPSVCLFSVLAVVISRLPEGSASVRMIEMAILTASALFAVWMIGIRHIYRQAARATPPSSQPDKTKEADP